MNARTLAIALPVGLAAAGGGMYGGFALVRTAEHNDLAASKYQRVDHTPDGDVYKKTAHSENLTTGLEVAFGAVTAGVGWAVLKQGAPGALRTAAGGALIGIGLGAGVGGLFGNSLYSGGELHS